MRRVSFPFDYHCEDLDFSKKFTALLFAQAFERHCEGFDSDECMIRLATIPRFPVHSTPNGGQGVLRLHGVMAFAVRKRLLLGIQDMRVLRNECKPYRKD